MINLFLNTFLLKHLLLTPCRNPPPQSHWKLLSSNMSKVEQVHLQILLQQNFFLTFNINWLDLVNYCELGKILYVVLLKAYFKENYFHKQAVTTDKGSACTKELKYRRTTRSTRMLPHCAFKKLPTETTVTIASGHLTD